MKRSIFLLAAAACLSVSTGADGQILRALASGQNQNTETGTGREGTAGRTSEVRKAYAANAADGQADAATVMIAQWLEKNPSISYDGAMGAYTRRLVNASSLPLSIDELPAYTRVRSIQIDGTGLYSYDYFACRFFREGNLMRFRKQKGSQLKAGELSQVNERLISFDGCWFINGDKELYDDAHREKGCVTKVSRHKIILTIPREEGAFEILEFSKDDGPAAFTIEDEKGYLYSFTYDDEGNEELVLETGGDYDGDIIVPGSLEVDGIPVPVTTIRRGAMWKKEGAGNIGAITSVSLPPSVSLVGGDAFRGNHSLRSVSYGTMTRIENRAFFDCPQLELKPQNPVFAFTDPRASTASLEGAVVPCEEVNPALEGFHWAFFKQNHNSVDFERWKSQDLKNAMECFCFDLNLVKGMSYKFRNRKLNESLFKGYMKDSGHYMMLADNAFVATHDFPAFSRWIWGENEKSMPSAFAAQMGAKYGREVRRCCEVGRMTLTKDQLAITEFKVKNGQACFALSWVKDGKEVCSYTETTEAEGDYSVWNVDDDGLWGIPHLLTVAYDENGEVELFLTHGAPESVTFMHLKQNGTALEAVQKKSIYVYVDAPVPQIQAKKENVLSAWTGAGSPERFALFDIDEDGVQELFLCDSEGGRMEAYTVKDGKLEQIGAATPRMRVWFEVSKGYLYTVSSQPGESEMQSLRLENSRELVKYLKFFDPETQNVKSSYVVDTLGFSKEEDYRNIAEHFEHERTSVYELFQDRWYNLDWEFQYFGLW